MRRTTGSLLFLALWAPSLAPAQAGAEDLAITLRSDLPEDEFVVYKGDRFSVSFVANHDAYVTILALDEKRNVRILFPNRWQPDNEVRRGQEVTIDGIHADYAGPVYIEAIAAASEAFYFRHGDDENPFWSEGWGRFDPEESYLSERRGSFTISFDDESTPPARHSGTYDPSLRDDLADRVDADYDAFEPEVRSMRDDVYAVMGGEAWTSAYLDVYVAQTRFDPRSYEESPAPQAESGAASAPEEAAASGEAEATLEASQSFDYETAIGDYGTWIEIRGVRVWRPPLFSVAWRPFCHGYWIWSSYGWYWVGYEPFAWVTYHYGYWYCDAIYGWYWIPDYWNYRFVPANCNWYSHGSYVAWYPAPPPAAVAARMNVPVSASVDPTRVVLVDRKNFLRDNIHAVMEQPTQVTMMLKGATSRFGQEAPTREVIESTLGRKVSATPVATVEKRLAREERTISVVTPTVTKTPPAAFRALEGKVKHRLIGEPAGRARGSKDAPGASGARVQVPPRGARPQGSAPAPATSPQGEPAGTLLKPRIGNPHPGPTRRPPRGEQASPRSAPADSGPAAPKERPKASPPASPTATKPDPPAPSGKKPAPPPPVRDSEDRDDDEPKAASSPKSPKS